RQRLTVSRGFGVAEIHIPEGSEYVGKEIRNSGLRDKDINVLTLYRDARVIPNPRSDRVLRPGDRLLCFGRLDSMRAMVPEKVRRRRRPKTEALATGEGRTRSRAAAAPSGVADSEDSAIGSAVREDD
ncbi:MAG: TrkA C-terminal domain-containing protein, partial [Thermoanaerobaculales bacterium]|nr:TrkA C-terminal domain-containing protein [Thermoanaerobaculales bacterium]